MLSLVSHRQITSRALWTGLCPFLFHILQGLHKVIGVISKWSGTGTVCSSQFEGKRPWSSCVICRRCRQGSALNNCKKFSANFILLSYWVAYESLQRWVLWSGMFWWNLVFLCMVKKNLGWKRVSKKKFLLSDWCGVASGSWLIMCFLEFRQQWIWVNVVEVCHSKGS